jgi:hypothetical protein
LENKTSIRQASILGMIALLMVGCTALAILNPASEISTSAGLLTITKVEIATKDPAGNEATPGYQILLIWFEGAKGSVEGDLFEASENVYIAGDDGSETKRYFGGLALEGHVLGFTPPTTAQTFTLHWPGNPPVELDLSK